MKRLFLHIGTIMTCAVAVFAQSNVSAPMDFHIEKEIIPAVLNIVPGTLQFIDQDQNNVIDANETCKIRFQVSNTGRGDGYGCVARTTFTGHTQGITITDVHLPKIPTGAKHWVEIPIKANAYTQTGEIALNIVVNEPNGFGTDYIKSTIGTHKLRIPSINVVSYKVLGAGAGKLQRRIPFTLQIMVQNTDQGTAENVNINVLPPNNVNRIGGDVGNLTIAQLRAGEKRTLEYELIANQEAADQINIKIALSEKHGKYATGADIPLKFGQYLGGSVTLDVDRHDVDVEIEEGTLFSKVDMNIPVTRKINSNTFAVIIANENYYSVASVPFAINDGNIFRNYCIKTLGIPDEQVRYVCNATSNQIKEQIGWLQNICNAYRGVNIIFYYAGHGIPDLKTQSAYLLPVDGIGTDVSSGYKLDDLYSALGALPAKNITVFMDACFSGSTRESGKENMLVSARGVAIKSRRGIPQGNMVVFSAAQGDQTAYPYYEQQHGLFTYYLLEYLQKTSGHTTLQELGDYIVDKVRQKSAINNTPQTPCVTPSPTVGSSWKEWKLK